MLEWSKECQWHCLCRVLKTERVKVVRMKTIEDRREGESERRLRRKVTCEGACAMLGVSVRLEVMRKWSEVCSGVTNVLSVEQ